MHQTCQNRHFALVDLIGEIHYPLRLQAHFVQATKTCRPETKGYMLRLQAHFVQAAKGKGVHVALRSTFCSGSEDSHS